MKTCEKLRELQFHSIRMIEVRQRPFDARTVALETLDLGLGEADSATVQQNESSARDPTARWYTAKSPVPALPTPGEDKAVVQPQDHHSKRRKIDEGSAQAVDDRSEDDRDNDGEDQDKDEGQVDAQDGPREEGEVVPEHLLRRLLNRPLPSVSGSYTMHVARPFPTSKGHTAFLTFAVRPIS